MRHRSHLLVLALAVLAALPAQAERRDPEPEMGGVRAGLDELAQRSPEAETGRASLGVAPVARRLDAFDGQSYRRRRLDPRDFFEVLVPAPIPQLRVREGFFERLFDVLDPLWSQLIPGLLFFIVVSLVRRIFADDRELMSRSRTPYRIFILYFFLAGTVVFAGLYWTSVYRLFHLLSLFVLVLGDILTLTLLVADLFFERSRKVRIPVIVRDVIVIVLYVISAIIVLSRHGVDLTSILTGSVVLTAVVGLAFQDTLGSIASGLSIQLERPYQEGDWIDYEGELGKVLEINWRSTLMVTPRSDVVVVPNRLLTTHRLVNLSRPSMAHRREVVIGLPYDEAPNRCKAVLVAAARTAGVLTEPSPFAVVKAYDESSIRYVLYFFIDDMQHFNVIEDRVRTNVWYRLRRAGISIPYPTRHVTLREASFAADPTLSDAELTERVTAIGRVPFLAPLDDGDRRELARCLADSFWGAGETVFHQGEPGDSFFFIHSGEVEVLVARSGVGPQRVATLRGGDFFGEMSLMTGEPRSATIRTLADTRLFVVDHASFREVLAHHAAITAEIAAILDRRQAELARHLSEGAPPGTAGGAHPGDSLVDRIRAFFGL